MNPTQIVWHAPLSQSDGTCADHQALRESIYHLCGVMTGFTALEIRASGCMETFDSYHIADVPTVVLLRRPNIIHWDGAPDMSTLFMYLLAFGCRLRRQIASYSVTVSHFFPNPQEAVPAFQNVVVLIEDNGETACTDECHSESSAISQSAVQQRDDMAAGQASSADISQNLPINPSCSTQASRSRPGTE